MLPPLFSSARFRVFASTRRPGIRLKLNRACGVSYGPMHRFHRDAVPAPFVENTFFHPVARPRRFGQVSAGPSWAVSPLGFLFRAPSQLPPSCLMTVPLPRILKSGRANHPSAGIWTGIVKITLEVA